MNDKAKKTLNISLKIISWILVAFTVLMMIFTVLTVSTVDKHERNFFGMRFYIVLSDSMSKSENNADMDVHFNAGDIVISKMVDDTTTLKEGDIISFISRNEDNYGETVTHMIHEVKTGKNDRVVGYVTYGTNTGEIDKSVVEPDDVLGVYNGKIPGIGNLFLFLKTTPGYFVCIFVPFLLLILYFGINAIMLFRKYKKEQAEIIEAEKAEIAAERKQNEDMLRELMELKKQLEMQQSEALQNKSSPQDNSEGES